MLPEIFPKRVPSCRLLSQKKVENGVDVGSDAGAGKSMPFTIENGVDVGADVGASSASTSQQKTHTVSRCSEPEQL